MLGLRCVCKGQVCRRERDRSHPLCLRSLGRRFSPVGPVRLSHLTPLCRPAQSSTGARARARARARESVLEGLFQNSRQGHRSDTNFCLKPKKLFRVCAKKVMLAFCHSSIRCHKEPNPKSMHNSSFLLYFAFNSFLRK